MKSMSLMLQAFFGVEVFQRLRSLLNFAEWKFAMWHSSMSATATSESLFELSS
jgi:hypothetical protein